jgi:hypothetical protein
MARRLLAPVAIQAKDNTVISVDLGSFVRRILLFDTYVLQSVWLNDVQLLRQSLGDSGLIQLFQSGALKLYCESFMIGETGRARADLRLAGNNKRLPLSSYSFSVLRVQGQQQKIESGLARFGSPLQNEAANTLLFIDQQEFTKQVFDGFYADLRGTSDIVKCAVEIELRSLGIKPKRLKVEIEEIESEDFKAVHNLHSQYGLSEAKSHEVILKSLLAIGGLNQRFAEMMTHSALSGIRDNDLPLLQGKLNLVAALAGDVSHSEKRLERVVALAGLPNPVFGETRIDVDKLLGLRDSDECRAFRDWLAQSDSLSDKEIRERVKSLSSKIKLFLNTVPGKLTRFFVSAGLSLAPGVGPVLGIGASVVDAFILDKLAPKDAIVSFLSDSYPSVFKHSR